MRARRIVAVASSFVMVVAGFAACGQGPDIHVADFDQLCLQASDCVAVLDGEIPCCNTDCNDNAAINKSALAQYTADEEAHAPSCGDVECSAIECPPPPVACTSGRCVLAPKP
jgi:hypothetical protein